MTLTRKPAPWQNALVPAIRRVHRDEVSKGILERLCGDDILHQDLAAEVLKDQWQLSDVDLDAMTSYDRAIELWAQVGSLGLLPAEDCSTEARLCLKHGLKGLQSRTLCSLSSERC